DFGEVEAKSVTMLHLEDSGEARLERIPTPARPMYLLRARWDAVARDLVTPEPFPEDMRGADVRFIYETTRDHLEAARTRAKELRRGWLDAGAALVKDEDELDVT